MVETAGDAAEQDLRLDSVSFQSLMPHRVENLLLVCSMYESFILEEEGLLSELITSEYMDMNLTHAPRVMRASTPEEALEVIAAQPVDLVITLTQFRRMTLADFSQQAKSLRPGLPVVVLADELREVARRGDAGLESGVDRVFVWNGDARILLAIIKLVEDAMNVEHDAQVGDVRVIILVENSVRFYSTYLPLIYTELVKLTQALIADGVNLRHRLLRMRARPRILMAETFEEAWDLYAKFQANLLGVISDVRFPRQGKLDPAAGIEFTRRVRRDSPHLPVLMQSSNPEHAEAADALQVCFLHKQSPSLLRELRDFILNNMGFGDFVFMLPDGTEVGRAHDLRSLEEALRHIPDESLSFHAEHNHFSNWLMARTEFELASLLRTKDVKDFSGLADVRAFLLETVADFRERSQSGVITDFSARKFDIATSFTRIGGGSIGGKGRGLAFINSLILRHNLTRRFDGVRISVPHCAAIGTDVFDDFLDQNNLRRLTSRDCDDREIVRAFLAAKLPPAASGDLSTFLNLVRYPLAVRSSSLLEDSQDRPFAGIYATHMIPNNHRDLAVRRDQLCDAVKLVYASTFSRAARRYLESTGRRAEEEKMGVVVQQLVGSHYQDRFYPTFAGVARSYNYYPAANMKPDDGVAHVALGLGKTVVEGEESLMFCPTCPQILPQYSTSQDMLAHSQRHFYALDTSRPDAYPTAGDETHLLRLGLDVAEADGTLAPVGSIYSADNDMVFDGIVRPGPRLVSFAHVLKSGLFPLADILKLLLDLGADGMACPVEIEFAVDMRTKPMQFGFLQIRPVITREEYTDVRVSEVERDRMVCHSPQVLGNGRFTDLSDVLYVKPSAFDRAQTLKIAAELGVFNDKIRKVDRHCVLMGFGRWGSGDPWLGIPVTWDQISRALVIVESTLEDFVVAPSQGTHFFQNITSLGIGYFTVDHTVDKGYVDWDWLEHQAAVEEGEYVRWLRTARPIDVRIDGRSQHGFILKPVGS